MAPDRDFAPWTRPAPGTWELAPGLLVADTGARVGAYAVDMLVLFVIGRAITAAAGLPGSAIIVGSQGGMAATIAIVGVSAVYFIGSWSGGRRATLGQRLTRIEIGNAFDGKPLTLAQATRRWLGLGDWLLLANLVPDIWIAGALASSIANLVLLWTTYTSPVGQGLHDRFANSTAAQRDGGVRPAWLVLFAVLAWFVVTVALRGSRLG